MFAYNSEFSAGWHFNATHNYYQKVQGRVFVAVSPLLFGNYKAQLYHRGLARMSICVLEIRTHSESRYNVDDMFQIGEIWLQKYHSGDDRLLSDDQYHVESPHGVWGSQHHHEKLFWV